MDKKKLKLRTLRLIAGYSVEESAKKIGVSEKSIRSWENNSDALKAAKFDSIVTLCNLYGASVDELDY